MGFRGRAWAIVLNVLGGASALFGLGLVVHTHVSDRNAFDVQELDHTLDVDDEVRGGASSDLWASARGGASIVFASDATLGRAPALPTSTVQALRMPSREVLLLDGVGALFFLLGVGLLGLAALTRGLHRLASRLEPAPEAWPTPERLAALYPHHHHHL